MNLVWTDTALNDRKEIRHYIHQRNPIAALALDQAFSRLAAKLKQHPYLGKPGRVPSTREFAVHPNYILIYDIVAQQIRIIRILHAARKWPPLPR